jgi:hypothetical protein
MCVRLYIDIETGEVRYELFEPNCVLIAVSESEASFFMDGNGNRLPYVVQGRLFWIVMIDKDRRVKHNVYGDIDRVYEVLETGPEQAIYGSIQLTNPDDKTKPIDDVCDEEEQRDKICRALMQGQMLAEPIVVQERAYGIEQNLVVISECSLLD